MRHELDAILKGCGRPKKGVSEGVWCLVEDEECLMPDDTPDCPIWIEWQEESRKSDTKRKVEGLC